MESGRAFFELCVQDSFCLIVEVKFLLEGGIEPIPVVVVGRPLEVHLLDFLLFCLDARLEGLHLPGHLFDEVPHDQVFLVQGEED